MLGVSGQALAWYFLKVLWGLLFCCPSPSMLLGLCLIKSCFQGMSDQFIGFSSVSRSSRDHWVDPHVTSPAIPELTEMILSQEKKNKTYVWWEIVIGRRLSSCSKIEISIRWATIWGSEIVVTASKPWRQRKAGSRHLIINEQILSRSLVVFPIPPASTCPLRTLVLLGILYFDRNLSYHNILWVKVGLFHTHWECKWFLLSYSFKGK